MTISQSILMSLLRDNKQNNRIPCPYLRGMWCSVSQSWPMKPLTSDNESRLCWWRGTPEWQAGTAWRSCLGSHGHDSERSVMFVPTSCEGEMSWLKKQLFRSSLTLLTTGAVFMTEKVICIQKAAFYFIHILWLLQSFSPFFQSVPMPAE